VPMASARAVTASVLAIAFFVRGFMDYLLPVARELEKIVSQQMRP